VQTIQLFTNDILCLFVGPQSEKDRLTKLVILRPLRELDLGDQYRFNPVATFHDCGRDALAPSTSFLLREVYKGASRAFEFLQAGVEVRQNLFGKSGSHSAAKSSPFGLW
jgi:hypothetical protein